MHAILKRYYQSRLRQGDSRVSTLGGKIEVKGACNFFLLLGLHIKESMMNNSTESALDNVK